MQEKATEPFCPTCPVTTAEHNKYAGLVSWLQFNPRATQFDTSLMAGYLGVPIKGYSENNVVSKYFQNAKASVQLQFKLKHQLQINLAYRFALFNTQVTPFFKYQLKNYTVHQPKFELKGRDFFLRTYATIENSGSSYNLYKAAYLLGPKIYGPYAANYMWAFSDAYFNTIDSLTSNCSTCFEGTGRGWVLDSARNVARVVAGKLYYPARGNQVFDTAFTSIIKNANPAQGAALRVISKIVYAEGEYRFGFQHWMNAQLGANYHATFITNNEWNTRGKVFHDVAVYANADKSFIKNLLTLFASGRFNYTTDFTPRGDYRAGLSVNVSNQTITIATGSGYVLPTLQQRYTDFINYSPVIYGNNLASGTWYTGASIYNFQNAYGNNPFKLDSALKLLKTYTVEVLKPQTTRTIELTVKNLIAQRLLITTHAFFNWVNNTTALASLVNPSKDTIVGIAGKESGENNVVTGLYTPFYTWVTVPVKTNSWGVFCRVDYFAKYGLNPYINYNYFGHKTIVVSDEAILSFNDFNMPAHKLNIGLKGAEVWKGLGFAINFRWESKCTWQNEFRSPVTLSAYHALDAEIQYNIHKVYSTVAIGGTNIYNMQHTEFPGSPRVGAWYYVSWKFDMGLNHKR